MISLWTHLVWMAVPFVISTAVVYGVPSDKGSYQRKEGDTA